MTELEMVIKNPLNIVLIENPSKEVQLATVMRNGLLIQ